jgi:tetratricopeptide (TPR) repeat protein
LVEQPKQNRKRWSLRRLLLAILLLALIAFGAYSAGIHFWAEYQLRAARHDLEQRDFSEASRRLALCMKVRPENVDICLLAAQAARRSRDYAEADRLLKRYRSLGGDARAASLERALERAQRGELAGGIESFLWATLEQDRPNDPLILEALAQGYMATFRWGLALGCLKRLLECWPNDAEVLVWRGWVSENLHLLPAARDDYRRALELNPEHEEARLRLAEALLLSSQPEEALEHLTRLQPRQPNNPALLLALARCRRELNQPDEARALLERLLAEHPDDTLVLTERGKLALSQGQAAEAEDWLRKALALAPFERETNYQLALSLRQQGKEQEAVACLARLKRIEADQERLAGLFAAMVEKPRDLSLRREAGAILLSNGQTKEGLGLLQSVLAEDAEDRPTHALLADYYQRIGNRGLADTHRRQAQ